MMSERINLAEIEARCEAATDGPWGYSRGWIQAKSGSFCYLASMQNDATEQADCDGQLMAHARTDLPTLIAWVKGAARVLGIAREGCASAGATYAVAGIDVLLSRLEVER